MARVPLYDSPVHIFNESASKIDAECGNDMMAEIHRLVKTSSFIKNLHPPSIDFGGNKPFWPTIAL